MGKSRKSTSKSSKSSKSSKVSRRENPWILFSNKFYKLRRESERIKRTDAMKLAKEEWKKMVPLEKHQWYQLSNKNKLMKKVEENILLLNLTNVKSYFETCNDPFIIEDFSIMSCVNQPKINILNNESDVIPYAYNEIEEAGVEIWPNCIDQSTNNLFLNNESGFDFEKLNDLYESEASVNADNEIEEILSGFDFEKLNNPFLNNESGALIEKNNTDNEILSVFDFEKLNDPFLNNESGAFVEKNNTDNEIEEIEIDFEKLKVTSSDNSLNNESEAKVEEIDPFDMFINPEVYYEEKH